MAPSTAVLFLILGVAVVAHSLASIGKSRIRWIRAAALVAVAAAVVLGVLAAFGIHSSVEHLGFAIKGSVGPAPLGHMSPVTATCFVLAGTSLFALNRDLSDRSLSSWISSGFAALSALTSGVFLLAYLYGNPLFYGGTTIPPAVSTMSAFFILGAALFAMAKRRAIPVVANDTPMRGPFRLFLSLYVLLAAIIIAMGYYFYHGYEHRYRSEVEQRLSVIAKLKTEDLSKWRQERLGDGSVFFDNVSFIVLVRQFLVDSTDEAIRLRLFTWLEKVRTAYGYNRVFLLDDKGNERMAAPVSNESPCAHYAADVVRCLKDRKVMMSDFHRHDDDGRIYLSVMTPLIDREDHDRPLGVLVLRIDPHAYLYPFIKTWPSPSGSAETLLVRREGDDAVFLNELRFRSGTALSLRIPLTQTRTPAVRAALGQLGVMEGVDYRGVPVIAAVQPVPDSPWSMVARIDASEVYTPLSDRLWMMVVLVAALLLGTGAGFSMLWRREALRFYRDRYAAAEALRKSEAELKARNDELTRFTYTVSHDLKSPLVTIQTFLGYLEHDLKQEDRPSIAKDLGFIGAAAVKMSALLEDLLALSRVGRKMNPPGEISLQALVKEAMVLVAGRAAATDAEIVVTEAPVRLFGDRARLAEVFQNLLDNAMKFVDKGTRPFIEIGIEADGKEPVLFVRDNGIGIDPRHQAKLFGLFEKLEPSSDGTGIGLALVRRIVEVHGGRIWVESEGRGKGACFKLTLSRTAIVKQ
jgi:signal transduction histidine kinase